MAATYEVKKQETDSKDRSEVSRSPHIISSKVEGQVVRLPTVESRLAGLPGQWINNSNSSSGGEPDDSFRGSVNNSVQNQNVPQIMISDLASSSKLSAVQNCSPDLE